MHVFYLIFLFVLGIISLYIGAEALVRGAIRVSRLLGISPLIVGLTVVSFGTSAPEFMVSIVAALQHSRDIAIGNIIGSNIANIGLIIGLSALVKPLVVNRQMLFRQAPILILSSFLVFFFFYNNYFSSFEGYVLLFFMIVFLVSIILMAQKEQKSKPQPTVVNVEKELQRFTPEFPISFLQMIHNKIISTNSYVINSVLIILGIILLALGSHWLINSAQELARMMGVSDVIIGITVIAVGTSLPELATSVVSAIKKEADISVGNIVGSNLFNTLFVLGFVGVVNPISIDKHTIFVLVPIMIAFTLVFAIIMWSRRKITRYEAGILFVGYIIFISYLFIASS